MTQRLIRDEAEVPEVFELLEGVEDVISALERHSGVKPGDAATAASLAEHHIRDAYARLPAPHFDDGV